MRILGLSALTHDPAAALLADAGLEAAFEESKLARSRAIAGIPREAIRFCLEKARIGWNDLDYIALASRPQRAWMRLAAFRARSFSVAPISSGYYESKLLGELSRELNNLRILRLLAKNPRCRVIGLEHHLCHAASAFYASPFDRAAILTLDEEGDGWSGLLAAGEGTSIRVLRTIPFPHSLGWVFTLVTDLLGFAPRLEEHKTQWLSLAGEPEFLDLFLEMFRHRSGALPRLDRRFFTRGLAGRIAFSTEFYRRIGIPSAPPAGLSDPLRRALASSLQRACTVIVLDLARKLREETRAQHLSLSGGLFLNPLLVTELEQNSGFEHVFVQPAAGNAGCALGAAWLVRHQLLGQPRENPVSHLYLGPAFSEREIKEVLDNCKARYRWCDTEDEKLRATVELLRAGKIVAWVQGAAEFGPRALGNRSLLASPWAPFVRENLNDYVKHREGFRPFAVSVPAEAAAEYFEYSANARFLAALGVVREAHRELLKDFVLPDGQIRLHVVEQDANPLFWRLLQCWGERAPAPILVNTSFNLFGEPLVITPRDAVRSFLCSGTDALVIGKFLLTKD